MIHVRIAPASPAGPVMLPVASRVVDVRRVTLDVRGLPAETATAFLTGACLQAWRHDRLRALGNEDTLPFVGGVPWAHLEPHR